MCLSSSRFASARTRVGNPPHRASSLTHAVVQKRGRVQIARLSRCRVESPRDVRYNPPPCPSTPRCLRLLQFVMPARFCPNQGPRAAGLCQRSPKSSIRLRRPPVRRRQHSDGYGSSLHESVRKGSAVTRTLVRPGRCSFVRTPRESREGGLRRPTPLANRTRALQRSRSRSSTAPPETPVGGATPDRRPSKSLFGHCSTAPRDGEACFIPNATCTRRERSISAIACCRCPSASANVTFHRARRTRRHSRVARRSGLPPDVG